MPFSLFRRDGRSSERSIGSVTIQGRVDHTNYRPAKIAVKVKDEGIVVTGSKKLDGRQYELEPPAEDGEPPTLHLADSRAPRVRVFKSENCYYCGPETRPLGVNGARTSGHSTACMILGNKSVKAGGSGYKLRVGDLLRMGSVGLIVSEINYGTPGNSHALTRQQIAELSESVLSGNAKCVELSSPAHSEFASCSAEPPHLSEGEDNVDSAVCYICYDPSAPDNYLISPCECKGDTKFVHIKCLQRWNDSCTSRICYTTDLGAEQEICSVCKTPFASQVRLPDGRTRSLLLSKLPPPYVSFVAVSRLESEANLKGSLFQLSFATVLDHRGKATRSLSMGRAVGCDMVLPFRTVSTHHAQLAFTGNSFELTDLKSSNGTLLLLRRPVQLPFGRTTHLKVGRTVLRLTAKPSWRFRLSISKRIGQDPMEDTVRESSGIVMSDEDIPWSAAQLGATTSIMGRSLAELSERDDDEGRGEDEDEEGAAGDGGDDDYDDEEDDDDGDNGKDIKGPTASTGSRPHSLRWSQGTHTESLGRESDSGVTLGTSSGRVVRLSPMGPVSQEGGSVDVAGADVRSTAMSVAAPSTKRPFGTRTSSEDDTNNDEAWTLEQKLDESPMLSPINSPAPSIVSSASTYGRKRGSVDHDITERRISSCAFQRDFDGDFEEFGDEFEVASSCAAMAPSECSVAASQGSMRPN